MFNYVPSKERDANDSEQSLKVQAALYLQFMPKRKLENINFTKDGLIVDKVNAVQKMNTLIERLYLKIKLYESEYFDMKASIED